MTVSTQRHAGVLILIRRALTDVAAVRHTAAVPGKLLRVRFPLGKSTRMISVICAYQHAWAPRDPHNMEKRQEFWLRLGNCVGSVPQRELLVAGGDLNVQLAPFHPHIGHGTGVLSPEKTLDADTLNHLLAAHSLVVINTWGTPGSKAHTFRFGKHQAQLDFLLMRLTDTDAQARKACPLRNCPVGSWRNGGLHSPIITTLPFRYTQFRSLSHKPVQADVEKIVAIAKDPHRETDPIAVEFRKEVAAKLQPLQTIEDVGNIDDCSSCCCQTFPTLPTL